ncbi:MAG: hypothetical protein GY750_19325 [Lentisphaerae bacterium]|nr:hypothetical protein [Lentisphaerota bacterium]MCP4103550.1 hypothetical protein [Lentisphaerota bacterium]
MYSSGDANILDQIKMNDKIENYKININCRYGIIIQGLFKYINLDGDPSFKDANADVEKGKVAGGSAPLPTTTLNLLESKISDRTDPFPDKFYTRSQSINTFNNSSFFAALTTDLRREELIGKYINLTRTGAEYEYYNVIILAQTIKDIGTGAGINITKLKSDGYPLIVNCTLGTFDYDDTNKIYFDEITAEQKLLALVKRLPSGKCKILSVEKIYD